MKKLFIFLSLLFFGFGGLSQGLNIDNLGDDIVHFVTSKGVYRIVPQWRAENLTYKAELGELYQQNEYKLRLITEARDICQGRYYLCMEANAEYKLKADQMFEKSEKAIHIAKHERHIRIQAEEKASRWKDKALKFKKQRNRRSGLLYTVTVLGGGYLIYSIIQNN